MNLFFVVLFLALLVYIYQLGYSKRENLRLIEEQKVYELEREEFNSLVETTKQLREIKHDIQIYLDTINILVNDKNGTNLSHILNNIIIPFQLHTSQFQQEILQLIAFLHQN